jgi:hypothetical protein
MHNFHPVPIMQDVTGELAARHNLHIDLHGYAFVSQVLLLDKGLDGLPVIALTGLAVKVDMHRVLTLKNCVIDTMAHIDRIGYRVWLRDICQYPNIEPHCRVSLYAGYESCPLFLTDTERFLLLDFFLGMPGNTYVQTVTIIILIGSYLQVQQPVRAHHGAAVFIAEGYFPPGYTPGNGLEHILYGLVVLQ